MVVHTRVCQVLRHILDYVASRRVQQIPLASQIEAQQRVAILKALRPLRPTACRVSTACCKDGRPISSFPAPIEPQRLPGCKLQRAVDTRLQTLGSDRVRSEEH